MTRARQDLLTKVPTLTEVADVPPDPTALHRAVVDEHTARWVDDVMDRLAPQVNALLSSRLRDVLAPAVQDAVQDAVERCRGPLIEGVADRLRDILEQEVARKASAAAEAPHRPEPPRKGLPRT
jgi:hypothetical protein